MNLGYFRTAWSNFRVTDSQNVTTADCSEFCITLRAGGPNAGQPLSGLFDLKPTVAIGGTRLQGTFDIYNAYNALNESTVLSHGRSWRTPMDVLNARIFKVGVAVSF